VIAVTKLRPAHLVGSTLRRNFLTTGVMGFAVYALGLVTGPIVARALGPTGRGDLAAVLVPAELFGSALALGLPSAAAYLVREFDRGTLLATSTAFGLAAGIPLVAIVWPLLPEYYQHHGAAALFWAYVFLASAPLSVGTVAAFCLVWADGANLRWNLWRVAPTVLTAALTVGLFVTSRLTVWTALAAAFLGAFSITALFIQGALQWRRFRVSLNALRCQLSYGARVAVGRLADSVASRLDQALLVTMVPSADLGLYAVAVTAAGASEPLAAALGLALFPELRRDDAPEEQRRRTGRALATVLVCSTLVAAVLALLGPLLLDLLFGSDFAHAATPLRLLLLGQVAKDATNPLTAQLLAINRPGATSQASAVAGIITVAGLLFLVPRSGINGAAATTTISYLVRLGYSAISVRRQMSGEAVGDLTTQASRVGGGYSHVRRNRS
jgi:O-antigen/teichoic acid export membrane protein